MTVALLVILLVLTALYGHVSNNVEKYANSGNAVSRMIVLLTGLVMGGGGAYLFSMNVSDPGWAFGIGFVLGPMFAVGATLYLVVALFFSLRQVQGLLQYTFRHKLTDKI